MKRILRSCLLLTLIFLINTSSAQVFNFQITPQTQCYSPGNNSVQAVVTVTFSGPPTPAASYTWAISNPAPSSCSSVAVPAVAGGTACNFAIPCCGIYTITCFPVDGTGNIIPFSAAQQTLLVECPITPTLGSSAGVSQSVCAGATTTLTALGGATWTWTPGNLSGSSPTIAPTANTCYTAAGNTAVGCTLLASYCLTVQTLNALITPPTQTICAGMSVTLAANASATGPVTGPILYQWYESPPIGAPVATLGTASQETVTPLATTVYTLNTFVSTCSLSLTNTITIGPAISMTAIASSASVCPRETVTLTAYSAATSFTWTSPTSPTFNPSQSTTPSQTFAVGPGIYIVNGASTVCPADSYTLTIFPSSFTPTITSTPTIVCPGQSFTLTGFGGVPSTYTFASLNALGQPTAIVGTPGFSTVAAAQTNSTVYGVGMENASTCQASQTIAVGISPDVTVSVAASAASVCASSPVTLTASGAALYTFVSSTSGTLSPSSTTSVIIDNPTSNTTYSVYGTNAILYCGSMTVITVNMISNGTLTLTTAVSSPTFCPGQTTTITVSGALSYTWTSAGPSVSLSATSGTIVSGSPSVSTVYTVTGNNNGGCTGVATISITVIPQPTVVITTSNSAVCAGYTSTLTASGAVSYTWQGSTFQTPVVNQTSISVSPGVYTVEGTPSGVQCKSNPAFYTVTLAPPLPITASRSVIQGTTCIEQNYDIKLSKPIVLTASGAQSYIWFPYNPLYMTYSLGVSTTVRPPTTTCYTVTGLSTACSGSAVICVTVIPQFTMNVVPPLPAICLGDSIRLSIVNIQTLAVGVSTVGLPNSLTYEWLDPANAPQPSLTSYTFPIVKAFPQNTATYTVQVTDTRSCVSLPRLVTVTVLPQPLTAIAIPTINNVPTNTVCFVGDIPGAPDNQLQLTAYNYNQNLPPGVSATYTWSSSYNPPSIVTSTSQAQVTIIAPTRLPGVAIYTVTSGYNGIPGCKAVDTVAVRVIDCRPVINKNVMFDMDVNKTDTLCTRNCVTYIAASDTLAGGPQTYTWTFTGGLPSVSYERSPTVCYDLPNLDGWTVILKIGNQYPVYEPVPGSVGTKSFYQFMKVADYPNVTIVPPGQKQSDTTIKFSQSIVLTATNAVTYSWSPRYSISSITGSMVTVNPTKTTKYIVTGKNSSNCFSSDTINVIVIEDCGDMFVPNAFSPNGDEINDVLLVRGVCLETLTFIIFNRWGEKVFETNDINIGWDGTYHGEKLNTGVFVYRLEGKTYQGKGFSTKGNITLIR